MGINQLAAAVQVLRQAITGGLPRAVAGVLLELFASCAALLLQLSTALRQIDDPRVAATHAHLVEQLYRHCVREQLQSAIHLESTGAHLLHDSELDAARNMRSDLDTPPRQHAGRAHYQNTGDFLAGWLGLNVHEGRRRLDDAHLLIARRRMDGSTTTARLARLAALFTGSAESDPMLDPRLIARAARTLDSFEPADTCFQGQPLAATARGADGQLLEEHVMRIFAEPDASTRESLLNSLLAAERKSRKHLKEPEPGIFFRAEVGQCDRYELFVGGSQREEFRSFIAQADNPRTEAGKAARAAIQAAGKSAGTKGSQADNDLFSSKEPPPPWAQEEAAPEEWAGEEPADVETDDEGADNSGPEDEDAAPGDSTLEEPAEEHAEETADAGSALLGDGDVSVAQRRLNALLASMKKPDATQGKSIAPRIAVHMTLESLANAGCPELLTSRSEHGLTFDSAQTAQLICQAEIYRVIFGPDGQPLDIGRQGRFFTEAMKRAIFARDRGCIVPGCTAPPEMLEYHHNHWWERGGCTSVRNGSCLCRRHHHAIHAGLLTLVTVAGLPHILMPKHLDPGQRPQRNQLAAA